MTNHELAQCAQTMQGLRHALLVLSGKWKLQIIVALQTGTRHFRGLERSVPGISTKVLAKELKDLEAHHFIARTVHPGPPVLVEYHVLPYARTLDPVIEVLKAWGIQHQQRLEAGEAVLVPAKLSSEAQ
ncbi:winged helix-turn-helix transcriptional regulator [Hymenobacter cellulosilyticus]|uniref:Helix-turn-helix transcriptional regulator n=1 Tax=Hymenobacter cellulosilyticus TaxID=2932248 RepID=A0A8T9Q4Q1_9BACT|nr:helix-turn-helix domain-containing protein [Hymenobacter cellulosilyticus]UOQ71411.1 helix-turn-helix transcriptional regulator [Hymenobacter cellulosilyticus]